MKIHYSQGLLVSYQYFVLLCAFAAGQSPLSDLQQCKNINTGINNTATSIIWPRTLFSDDSQSWGGNELTFQSEEMMNSSSQLDELFNETLVTFYSFIVNQNRTMGNFALNLSRMYINQLESVIFSVHKVNNTTLLQNNNLTLLNISDNKQKNDADGGGGDDMDNDDDYDDDYGDDEDDYDDNDDIKYIQSLYVAKVINFEINTVLNNYEETNQFNLTHETEKNWTLLFQEFHSIINQSNKIRKLNDVVATQISNNNQGNHIDLEAIIDLLNIVIPIQCLILEKINDVKDFQTVYQADQILISNDTTCLLDELYWKAELNKSIKNLNKAQKMYDVEKLTHFLESVVLPFLNSTVFIVGMIGNIMLLVIFATQKQMRSPPNLMVINLTISDTINLIVNALLDIIDHLFPWRLGMFLCQVFWFFKYLSMGLSVYSVVVISLQRFFALRNNSGFGSYIFLSTGIYKSMLLIFSVWVFTSAISSPRAYLSYVDIRIEKCRCCRISSSGFVQLAFVEFVIFCLFPLTLIGITSAASIRRLENSVKNMPGEALGKKKAIQSRVLSSKILFALTIVFAVSYIPTLIFPVLDSYFDLGINQIEFLTIDYIFFAITFISPCFNPIALFLASSRYRRIMLKYFMCKHKAIAYTSDGNTTSTTNFETRL